MERYLKLFTFIPTSDITALMAEHSTDPGKRKAQHLLASEVLELVHGRDEAERTRAKHQAMRNPSLVSSGNTGTAEERIVLPSSWVLDTPFAHILFNAGIASSKSEGARLVAKGRVYIASKTTEGDSEELNFKQIKDQGPEDIADLIVDGRLILRIGKWKVGVIEVV